jgi:hypothetical protein
MNWNGFGRKQSWRNRGTAQTFAWRARGIIRRTWIRTVCVSEIQTGYLPNTNTLLHQPFWYNTQGWNITLCPTVLQLSPWNRVLTERLIVYQLFNVLNAFYGGTNSRVSNHFWQRATTVIVGWFAGFTCKNQDTFHSWPPKLLFFILYLI